MVVGLVLGYIARQMGPDAAGGANWLVQTLSTVGSAFVSLLRALVPVLVFTAIAPLIAAILLVILIGMVTRAIARVRRRTRGDTISAVDGSLTFSRPPARRIASPSGRDPAGAGWRHHQRG